MSALDAGIFGVLSMFVAIFSAIKVFTWTGTLYKGSISNRDWDVPGHDGCGCCPTDSSSSGARYLSPCATVRMASTTSAADCRLLA